MTTPLPRPPAAAPVVAQVVPGDVDLAARLGSLELSYVRAYQGIIGRGGLPPEETELLTVLASHHLAHASAFQTLLRVFDRDADPVASDPDLDAELAAAIGSARGRAGLLAVALQVEEVAAASATLAVERAGGVRAVELTAEVAPVEAQHALLVATLLDRPAGERLADFETTTAQRLDP